MFLDAYRSVLALPRVLPTMSFMFLAGLPLTMLGLSLTLHALSDLHRSYTEAGLVGAATTLGAALGSPLVGRMLDRFGLRPVILVCGTVSTLLWCAIPFVPYEALLALVLPATMMGVPIGSLARQFLTSLVPADQRRSAFALNTILMEVSFIVGPALCLLLISAFSASTALVGIGIWRAINCVGLYITDFPTRSAQEAEEALSTARPPMSSWMSGELAGALLVATGALFVLYGTELALIAALRQLERESWVGLAMGGMACISIIGGLVHGAVRRSWSQATLAIWLAGLLLPVAWVTHSPWALLFALIPMNLFCTPTMTANSEAVAELAPAQVRGEVMGMQEAATRIGQVLAGPAIGMAIDNGSAAMGFLAAGLGGLLLAGLGLLCGRRFRRERDFPAVSPGAQVNLATHQPEPIARQPIPQPPA